MFEDMMCIYEMCERAVNEKWVIECVQKEKEDDDEVVRERKAWKKRSEVSILDLYISISILLCTRVTQST